MKAWIRREGKVMKGGTRWLLKLSLAFIILICIYLRVLNLFLCTYGIFVYILWRYVYLNPWPIKNWLFKNCWALSIFVIVRVCYIFWITILIIYMICKYYFAGMLYSTKFLMLMKANLSLFPLLFMILVLHLRSHCLSQDNKYLFTFMFFLYESNSSISYLWVKIHLSYFSYIVRGKGSNFISLHFDIQLYWYYLLKRIYIPHWID